MVGLKTMRRAEIILPLETVPRDGTTVRLRSARDGEWHEAAWMAADAQRGDFKIMSGRWVKNSDGVSIAHDDVDAWRPSLARAIAVHRAGRSGDPRGN